MRGYASARVRIEFRDWKQVLRSREGRETRVGGEKKKKKKEGWLDGPWLVFGRPFPLLHPGLLSKAFRRGAKIGERF